MAHHKLANKSKKLFLECNRKIGISINLLYVTHVIFLYYISLCNISTQYTQYIIYRFRDTMVKKR